MVRTRKDLEAFCINAQVEVLSLQQRDTDRITQEESRETKNYEQSFSILWELPIL